MAYIGSTPTSQNFIAGTDYFNGTGSQTAFTLTRSVNSVNDIQVTVNNVVQLPSSYTVSGTTLTLSAAPSSGTSNVYVRYLATNQQSFTVPNNSIGYNQLTTDLQADFGMKNRIINGDMRIDQRNAGASVSAVNGGYTLDRYVTTSYAGGPVTGKYTVQQNAGSVTPPSGFKNYLGITSSAATSVGAGDIYVITQPIEGLNISDLNWGTANAKTITLSFWVRSSLTGTFGGALNNDGGNYNYPYTYTISSANTWEYKTITIAGPTAGTWLTTNGAGIFVRFGLGGGTTWTEPAGSWTTSLAYSADSSVNVVSTNGATFYITGVQLEVGTSATGFEYRQYGQELALCQRYYYSFDADSVYTCFCTLSAYASTAANGGMIAFPVKMRTKPTFSYAAALANYQLQNSIGGGLTPTAIQSVAGTENSNATQITVTVASGLTAGNATNLFANNSVLPKLQFSAEL